MKLIPKKILNQFDKLVLHFCGVKDWSLDYPSIRHGLKISDYGVLLEGWIKPFRAQSNFKVIIKYNKYYEIVVPVNKYRKDVTGIEEGQQPYLPGFKAWISPEFKEFDIYFQLNEIRKKIKHVNLNHIEKNQNIVLETKVSAISGKEGWLYLSNDGNHSYLQAQGMITLTKLSRDLWAEYFYDLTKLQKNMKVSFVVAPCKERVVSQHYNFSVSKESIVDQIAIPENLLVYPLTALINLGGESYKKTDTHWSQAGALTTFEQLCLKLGIKEEFVKAIYENDLWVERQHVGDLGNKVSPPSHCSAKVNKSSSILKYKIFDNGMPNFGRIFLLKNNDAAIRAKCLIFGSSSSYSMLGFAIRMFTDITFVHSAGSIDLKIIDVEKPDYMVAQSNERFMLMPASLDFNTLDRQRAKVEASDFDIEYVIKNQIIPEHISNWNPLYKDLLVSMD